MYDVRDRTGLRGAFTPLRGGRTRIWRARSCHCNLDFPSRLQSQDPVPATGTGRSVRCDCNIENSSRLQKHGLDRPARWPHDARPNGGLPGRLRPTSLLGMPDHATVIWKKTQDYGKLQSCVGVRTVPRQAPVVEEVSPTPREQPSLSGDWPRVPVGGRGKKSGLAPVSCGPKKNRAWPLFLVAPVSCWERSAPHSPTIHGRCGAPRSQG